MELVQQMMKDMLDGERVRIGWQGVMPIFSLTQALNLASGLAGSHQFGSSFIHQTMKDKYPELYSEITSS
jgi:hypothetical protein